MRGRRSTRTIGVRNLQRTNLPLLAHNDDKGDFSRCARRLCGAVMLQAIGDMVNDGLIESYSALCWVKAGDSGSLTFDACCEALNRDPEGSRRALVGLHGTVIEERMRRHEERMAEIQAREDAEANAK